MDHIIHLCAITEIDNVLMLMCILMTYVWLIKITCVSMCGMYVMIYPGSKYWILHLCQRNIFLDVGFSTSSHTEVHLE